MFQKITEQSLEIVAVQNKTALNHRSSSLSATSPTVELHSDYDGDFFFYPGHEAAFWVTHSAGAAKQLNETFLLQHTLSLEIAATDPSGVG